MEYNIININDYNKNKINNFYNSLYLLKKDRISKYKHNLSYSNLKFMINEKGVQCNDNGVNVGFINDVKGYIISYCEKS